MEVENLQGLKTLLLTIEEQNKAILEQNRCLQNSITLIRDQNKKNDEDHRKNMDAIFKLQSHLAEEFIHLRTSVDTTMKSLRKINSAFFLPEISTPDDILSFDLQIKDDDYIKAQLIKKFGNQPCDDIRKFLIENLKLIFIDDKIASKFSWSVIKTNISVKDFYLIKLLKEVAAEKIPQTTNSTIEGHIKAYFNSSKDRLNKKLKRQHDSI